MPQKNYTLITGASGGIGLALAHEFAAKNHNLVLVARSEDKLKSACKEISQKHGVNAEYIVFDLSEYSNLPKLYKIIDEKSLKIDTLVNNAGFGANGDFVNLDIAKQIEMVNLNISALMSLSHYFAKQFKFQGFGKILNIGSIVSFQAVPYMAVYSATKWFVLSFSLALKKELENTGVSVTCFCPGPTSSHFFEKSGNILPPNSSQRMQTPEQVARLAYKALAKNKAYQISGFQNKFLVVLLKTLPQFMVLNIMAKMMKNE